MFKKHPIKTVLAIYFAFFIGSSVYYHFNPTAWWLLFPLSAGALYIIGLWLTKVFVR